MASEWKADAHEDPGVSTRRVLALVFGFLAVVAALMGGLGLYYRAILQNHLVVTTVRDFPAPRLQPNPTQDYANFRAAQVADRDAPVGPDGAPGHVPIARAMTIVAGRGAQAYDPAPGTPPAGPILATGAAVDGAPRATRSPGVAPYGAPP